MTYPAPPADPPRRARPDAAQFWAGAAATAVVAALVALVGILICRWTLHIPIMAPAGEGTWGNAHTGEYVLFTALIALVAAGLLYLLLLSTPRPGLFFRWIVGLATLAAVVYPFSTGAPLNQKVATAAVDLILGIAIGSLLSAVAARATSRPSRRPPPYGGGDGYGPGPGAGPGQAYPGQAYPGAGYPAQPGEPGYGAEPGYGGARGSGR